VPDEAYETNRESTGARLLKVARHIGETCGNSLDVVVATHRHKDHIYGFGLKEAGRLIVDCKPTVVIQPWTEDPADNRDLTKKAAAGAAGFKAEPQKSFASMLNDMHQVAAAIEAEATKLGDSAAFTKTIDRNLKDQIVFTADDNNIKNRAAVANLQAMGNAEGSKSHYVYFGYDGIDWDTILPGVKVHILGPPRLEDSAAIVSATNTSSEYWSLQAMNQYYWGVQAATNPPARGVNANAPLFSPEKAMADDRPPNIRWIVRQLRTVRASQLLEMVNFVDNALNNTSVILLFEVGDQKMLFPGDAQIENWQFALDTAKKDPKLMALLTGTTVYKVGHHGSRNATPRSLWKGFEKLSTDPKKADRLKTVISTMKGKHGESTNTAVPLPKMVKEMKLMSDYNSTEELKDKIFDHLEIDIS
jgi:hypothetical protein